MLFLLTIELDFLFSFLLGLFRYLGTLEGTPLYEDFMTEYADIGDPVALAVACFSGFCFLLVSPLLVVQMQNFCLHTTTYDRFAFNKRNRKTGPAPDPAELSDTSTMLLQPGGGDDISFSSSKLSSTQSIGSQRKKCCC